MIYGVGEAARRERDEYWCHWHIGDGQLRML